MTAISDMSPESSFRKNTKTNDRRFWDYLNTYDDVDWELRSLFTYQMEDNAFQREWLSFPAIWTRNWNSTSWKTNDSWFWDYLNAYDHVDWDLSSFFTYQMTDKALETEWLSYMVISAPRMKFDQFGKRMTVDFATIWTPTMMWTEN